MNKGCLVTPFLLRNDANDALSRLQKAKTTQYSVLARDRNSLFVQSTVSVNDDNDNNNNNNSGAAAVMASSATESSI